MAMDELILVDAKDNDIGYAEKESCHIIPTKLHRAFSIFILDSTGAMLIHKRSPVKKTWPDFWSNSCCSHPRKGEDLPDAVARRLQEELGFACPLQHLFRFTYKSNYDNEYGEHEIDHVFIGQYDGEVRPNPDEIADFKFITVKELSQDVEVHPEKYTPWFKKALPRVIRYIATHKDKTGTIEISLKKPRKTIG
ncbi:MAG: Isopentenyl-diphosphate Delta-isomerase [Syntrophorhabdus sp. PtaB.Bin006]|nr:MAG: Isopentenyl-diphosphate Delta-isomerase [Syntrophorhabdus sp. PtaB.Bin006]